MTTLPVSATPVNHAAERTVFGPDAVAALRTLRQLSQRQAEVADVLRRQRRDLLQWQDQLLRQSALLLVQRARIDWGLQPDLPARPLTAAPEAAPWAAGLFPHAHELICRTGCETDGDHWRDGERCRRTGEACDRSEPPATP